MSEIGVFFKIVIQQEKEDKAEQLTHMWMGANLQYEGIKEILVGMNRKTTSNEPTVKEINNDWKKLASFMVGRK